MGKAGKIKLTKRERDIIQKIRDGWVFLTEPGYAGIGRGKGEFERIRLDVFFRLVDKGLIFQNSREHFHYTLTLSGETSQI